jgi:hypothetical protein
MGGKETAISLRLSDFKSDMLVELLVALWYVLSTVQRFEACNQTSKPHLKHMLSVVTLYTFSKYSHAESSSIILLSNRK